MRKTYLAPLALLAAVTASQAPAADYLIDTANRHAFINFRISHQGFSYVYGTFRDFSGTFSFDGNNLPASSIDVTVQTDSIFTNNDQRDDDLRSADFLDTAKYPEAVFKSTKIEQSTSNTAEVTGELTLHGVTKPVVIHGRLVGQGTSSFGDERAGFIGNTVLKLEDFNIPTDDLGPTAKKLTMSFSFEGVRQ